jgi:outer membrane protein, heavy metal efflux system
VDEARKEISEPCSSELRRIEDQFRAGQIDFIQVYAAKSNIVQYRRAFLDSLNDLAQAAVAISSSTALPPDALLAARPRHLIEPAVTLPH